MYRPLRVPASIRRASFRRTLCRCLYREETESFPARSQPSPSLRGAPPPRRGWSSLPLSFKKKGAALSAAPLEPTRISPLPIKLLLWPRLRRNHAVGAIVDDQLAVVFAGVFDEAVGEVVQAEERGRANGHLFFQSFVALGFDDVRAVGNAFLDESHDLRLGFQFVALRIIAVPGLLSERGVSKKVHRRRGVQDVGGKRSRLRRRFVLVLVLRKILRHGNQFAPYIIPLIQDSLR